MPQSNAVLKLPRSRWVTTSVPVSMVPPVVMVPRPVVAPRIVIDVSVGIVIGVVYRPAVSIIVDAPVGPRYAV